MSDGQADNTAPETMDDLAAFLVDNPLEGDRPPREGRTDEGTETKPASKTTPDDTGDTEDDAHTAPDEDDEEPEPKKAKPDEDEDDEDEDEDDDKRTSDEKKLYPVTVKNDSGEDEKREVTLDELTKGYMRQADYSRKTAAGESSRQEFAQRGIAALENQRQRHAEALSANLRAMQKIAGLRTAEEMQYLANTDPSVYAQEQARQQVIHGFFQQTQQMIEGERAESQRQLKALQDQEMAHAWGVLGNQDIDKPKLRKIFDEGIKNYGFKPEHLAEVTNPQIVLMMRDANAYRELKAKTKAVTTKAQAAPPLPKPRQAAPRNERLAKQIDARFKGGNAKLSDLAAYIDVHKL
jgi:hypothetical protein